jgi:hypothetical protein
MSARLRCLAAAVPLLVLAASAASGQPGQAAVAKDTGRYGAAPLRGDYQVYGGELGDMQPPTRKDQKVAFMFTGPLAQHLFNQIGPDLKDACGSGPDHRARHRGDLDCIWDRGDGYSCYFGLNVTTGKSTYGSIC